MKSVQQLLDDLGHPPRDICLDWAWQLLDLCETELANSPPEKSKLNSTDRERQANWAGLFVSHEGRLNFVHSAEATAQPDATLGLIDQLLQWAGVSPEQLPTPLQESASPPATTAWLARRKLLSQLVGEEFQNRLPAGLTIIDLAEASKDPQQPELEDRPSLGDKIQLNIAEGSGAQDFEYSPRRKQQTGRPTKLRYLIVSGVTLILMGLLGILFSKDWLANDRTTMASNPPIAVGTNAVANPPDRLDESPESSELNSSDKQAVQPTQTRPEDAGEVQLSRFDTQALDIPAPAANQSNLVSGLSAGEPAGVASSLANAAVSMKLLQTDAGLPESKTDASASTAVPSTVQDSGQLTNQPETGNAIAEATSDKPQSDLASLIASVSANDPKINNLEQDVSQLPVQLLGIDAMLQVQEFPKLKVRQPLWELRIATTQAFTVEPVEAQVLSEKQMIQWTLLPRDLKPRKDQQPTKVFVWAQLSGRRADIKWKIAAVCDDLPGLALPLDDEKLDKLLTLLQTYQQQLTTTIAGFEAQLDATGLQREQRTLLSRNRRELEAEVKRVARARQYIADAGLFAGWMDRTIEVHGRLFDNVPNAKSELLKIGQPNVEAESQLDAK